MPMVPALRKLGKEGQKFEASLGSVERPCGKLNKMKQKTQSNSNKGRQNFSYAIRLSAKLNMFLLLIYI